MTDHEFKVGDRVQTIEGRHRGTVVRIVPDRYAWPVVVQWDGGMGGTGHFRHSELLPAKFKAGDRVKRDAAWWRVGVVANPAYSDRGYVRVETTQGIVTYPGGSLDFQEEEKVSVNTELEEYKKKVLAVALRTKNDPNVTFCESGFKAAMEELGLPYGPQDEYEESTVLEIVQGGHRVIALKGPEGWRYLRTSPSGSYEHLTGGNTWENILANLRAVGLDVDNATINVIA
jgi:hypothetical protein